MNIFFKRYNIIFGSYTPAILVSLCNFPDYDRILLNRLKGVNLLTLIKTLFRRNMCPLFLKFFIHSYCNQKMRIKWNTAIFCSFDTSNGVKQGGVLSPLVFNVYLDELILLLREQGVGWHIKCMFIDRSCSQLHSNVRFMGRTVEFVNSVDLLEVPLYADLKVNHIHRNVQKFYCNVNSVLFDFKDIPSDVKLN